jgi:ubiquinone/menaquinone biosynthesis C-methylase UbiE
MRSNREWRLWGERDPLYGVLTLPGHARGEAGAWTAKTFYEHGAREWPRLLHDWQSFGLDTSGACVEIGCGAGRLTQYLAQTFPRVYGLDVSPEMLAYARAHVEVPAAAKVSFMVVDGTSIPLPDCGATAVLSTHVFQHFDDPRDSLAYWCEIQRVLQPGGTCLIQLPIHHWPWAARAYQMSYWLRRFVGHLRAEYLRRNDKSFLRVVSYDSDWLLKSLSEIGFERIELRCTALVEAGQRVAPYWAVFARRGTR